MKVKLNTKLTLIFFGAIAVILSLFVLFSVKTLSSKLEQIIVADLREEAALRIDAIDRFMFERLSDLKALTSQQHAVLASDQVSMKQKLNYLRDIEQSTKEYTSMSIYDINGIRIGDTRGLKVGLDESNKSFFREAIRGNIYSDSTPVLSESLGINVIHFSAPIMDEHGNLKGVLVTRFSTNKIHDLIQKEGRGFSEIDLFDADGGLIFSTHRGSQCLEGCKDETIAEHPDADNLIVEATEQGFLDYAGNGWKLRIHMPASRAFSLVTNIQKNALFFSLVAVLLAVPLSLFISRTISRPINQLHTATQALQKGDFTARLNIQTGDELQELGGAFNKTAEALGRTEEQRKQIDNAKTRFLSITSHELRSPMTPMKAQLQMLEHGYYGKLNNKQKKSVRTVIRNADRLDTILSDFLELSRIEAARLKFGFKRTNLNKLLKDTVNYMKGFMPEKKITFVTKIRKLPVIEIDPDRVSQVLRNLIGNAIKFSRTKGVVTVTAKKKRNAIVFSVQDEGIGIGPEDQVRLFEPFFQAEQTIYRKRGGAGLGLAVCKGIIEAQNGALSVQSTLGKGSTFSFTLPLKPVREAKSISVLFSTHEGVKNRRTT